MKLTNSQEEYLKTIYLLQTKGKVRVTDIAKELEVAKPSVNKAIKNLNELELINYQTYGNIKLTKEGETLAKQILKKYDIVKIFLNQILEVPEEKAKEDAKSIKSVISEETGEKLENYITKILKLENLTCGYSMDNEKCRKCERIKTANKKGEKKC